MNVVFLNKNVPKLIKDKVKENLVPSIIVVECSELEAAAFLKRTHNGIYIDYLNVTNFSFLNAILNSFEIIDINYSEEQLNGVKAVNIKKESEIEIFCKMI